MKKLEERFPELVELAIKVEQLVSEPGNMKRFQDRLLEYDDLKHAYGRAVAKATTIKPESFLAVINDPSYRDKEAGPPHKNYRWIVAGFDCNQWHCRLQKQKAIPQGKEKCPFKECKGNKHGSDIYGWFPKPKSIKEKNPWPWNDTFGYIGQENKDFYLPTKYFLMVLLHDILCLSTTAIFDHTIFKKCRAIHNYYVGACPKRSNLLQKLDWFQLGGGKKVFPLVYDDVAADLKLDNQIESVADKAKVYGPKKMRTLYKIAKCIAEKPGIAPKYIIKKTGLEDATVRNNLVCLKQDFKFRNPTRGQYYAPTDYKNILQKMAKAAKKIIPDI